MCTYQNFSTIHSEIYNKDIIKGYGFDNVYSSLIDATNTNSQDKLLVFICWTLRYVEKTNNDESL